MSDPVPNPADFVLFYSHKPDKPFHEFSQWYKSDPIYSGQALYELDQFTYPMSIRFKTREHWMMWHKAMLFDNETLANTILNIDDPAKIKELGRKVSNFDEDAWNLLKYKIVANGNYLQFLQNPEMRKVLMSTDKKIIVEASPYDRVWGIGYASSDAFDNVPNWGSNLLGIALMETRNEFQRASDL